MRRPLPVLPVAAGCRCNDNPSRIASPRPGGGFCSCAAGGSPDFVPLRPCFRGLGCCGAVRADRPAVHAGHFRRRQRAPDDCGSCPAAPCAGRRAYDRLRGVHAQHDTARTPCLPGEALCAEDRLAGTVARLHVFPEQYAGGTGLWDKRIGDPKFRRLD